MTRYRQLAAVGALLTLVLFAVLSVGVPDTAAEEAAEEGRWQLDEPVIQAKVTNWNPEAANRRFSKMKVDIKDGVLSGDYTGPFQYYDTADIGISGTVTTSMRGTYSQKGGMSGTFHYEHHGTDRFGESVKQIHYTDECTFTEPGKLEDGGKYMVTLRCKNNTKPFQIVFKVARADVGQGPVPEAVVRSSTAHLGFGRDAPLNEVFYDWPDEPPDESSPSIESFSGDVEMTDPDQHLRDTWAGEVKGAWRAFTGLFAHIGGEAADPYSMEVWDKPKVGQVVKGETVIRTGSGGAKLVFKDGTTMTLKSGVDVVWRRGHIYVSPQSEHHTGELWVYKKFGRSVQLVTKRTRCSMFGTSYTLKTDGAKDVLEVFEGRVGVVLVKDPEKRVVVVAGEKVTVTDDALSPKEPIDVEKELQAWKAFEKAAESVKAPGSGGGCSLAPEAR